MISHPKPANQPALLMLCRSVPSTTWPCTFFTPAQDVFVYHIAIHTHAVNTVVFNMLFQEPQAPAVLKSVDFPCSISLLQMDHKVSIWDTHVNYILH